MSRESKKKQLRSQMISPGQEYPAARSRIEEETMQKARQKIRRRHMVLAAVLLISIFAGAGGWFYYQQIHRYTGYVTMRVVPLNEGSLVGYKTFGSNVLKYTRDGASYIASRGGNVWTESYEMKTPIVAVNGDYAAIADRQGNSILICNTDGKVGQATTILPITRITVSGLGMVAAVVEDSTSSYIYFFRKDGSELKINVRTNMSGDGYPLDICLSRGGEDAGGFLRLLGDWQECADPFGRRIRRTVYEYGGAESGLSERTLFLCVQYQWTGIFFGQESGESGGSSSVCHRRREYIRRLLFRRICRGDFVEQWRRERETSGGVPGRREPCIEQGIYL